MQLTKHDASRLSCALCFHKFASEELAKGDHDGYEIWCKMRDDHLIALFGKTFEEIHFFGMSDGM